MFDIVLGDEVVDALERLNDPVAALMALLAEQDGKLSRVLSRTQWEAQATAAELFDSRWILVYEGVGHGWLRPTAGDRALSDEFFADARGKAISFFNRPPLV